MKDLSFLTKTPWSIIGPEVSKRIAPVQPTISPIQDNPVVTPTPTPMPSPTPVPQNKVRSPDTDAFLSAVVLPITRSFGIPDEVAAGQFAAEGRTGGLGAGRNNYFNIGAYDSDAGQAQQYPTPEKGVEAYAKLMSGNFRKVNGALDTRYVPAYELRDNPEAMLRKIHELGYASRQDYPEFVMSTPEWTERSKKK